MIDMTAADEISGDARARSNVLRLAAPQALTGANSAVIFATGSIVGATLAPDISLATVPLSMYVVGIAAGTLPTGAISRAYGRRVAFIIGTGCGVLTGLLASFAILRGSFALFCCATFLRSADRRHLARVWPPRRLHHRHRLRRADRPARIIRHPARFVCAVLLCDLPRRTLRRGVAILSFRRRRRRPRRGSAH